MRESKIYAELIWRLFKEKKSKLISAVVIKLKNEGRGYFLKEIVNYLQEKLDKENNIIKGSLKLAFPENNLNIIIKILEKKLNSRVEIEKLETDQNLILGGIFIGKTIKIDFSFKKLINKLF